MTMTLEQMRDWAANTPARNGWQAKERAEIVSAIDAHLLSQEAEIERLQSGLAAADAMLETTERTLARCKQTLDTTSECWRLDSERLEAAERDSKRLDFMEREHCAVRVEATCDDDVFYEVVDYYMAEPQERVIGSGATPRDALDAAIHAAQEGKG